MRAKDVSVNGRGLVDSSTTTIVMSPDFARSRFCTIRGRCAVAVAACRQAFRRQSCRSSFVCGSSSPERASVRHRAEVLVASKHLAEVVGVCKPALQSDLLQRSLGFEQQSCCLMNTHLGSKASWAHASTCFEKMTEMGPAHAKFRRECRDVERVG